ncbi:unnamed protein product [Closterium sp. Yama58-4]|nr:unnamed protein product [Closterium sp. Yama58-4]
MTDNMIFTLDSFDERLSELERGIRPVQASTRHHQIIHSNVTKALDAATFMIEQYEKFREVARIIEDGGSRDIVKYRQALDRLAGIIAFFERHAEQGDASHALFCAKKLIQEGIRNMKDALRKELLELNDIDISDDERGNDGSSVLVSRLVGLVQALVKLGFAEDCVKIYVDVRRTCVEEFLQRSQIDWKSFKIADPASLKWKDIEGKLQTWMHMSAVLTSTVMSTEGLLAMRIFKGMDVLGARAKAGALAYTVNILVDTGVTFTSVLKSPEKLFATLDMYEAAEELLTQITLEKWDDVVKRVLSLKEKLCLVTVQTIHQLEAAIDNDDSKQLLNGTVHPLTSYVINYLKCCHERSSVLERMFVEVKKGPGSFSQLTQSILEMLLKNLDKKSKQYKDTSLGCVFMMNNVHHIVHQIQRCELKEVLGEAWLQQQKKFVQQSASAYRHAAWGKVFSLLSLSGEAAAVQADLQSISKGTIKERLKLFNTTFEELIAKQRLWAIPDAELRTSAQLLVGELVVPAYRSFLFHARSKMDQQVRHFPGSKDPLVKHKKYSLEEVESMIGRMADSQQASRPMAAEKVGSLPVDGLGALKRKGATRKRKRSRGDSLPSEREVKAAAVSGDDETPAALLAAARILARPSVGFAEASRAITAEERLHQALAHLPPPLSRLLSQNSMTTVPLASSPQLPGPSMTALTSTPLMALENSCADLLKGVPPLQPSSSLDLLTGNFHVRSSSHEDSLNRTFPLLLSRPVGSVNSSNPPTHGTLAPFSCMDPALTWFSPADELQKLQAAARKLQVPFTYECKECGRIFNQLQSLGGHMSRHRRDERRRIRRKKKVEADARKVAQSLCELLKASTSPESFGSAECPTDALEQNELRSNIPAIYVPDEQQSFQEVVASQQELLLYKQLLHHQLTILPDRLLVPPASHLLNQVIQQHEPATPSAAVQDNDTREVLPVQENDTREVPPPGGISGFVGVKRWENESLGGKRDEFWNVPKGFWSSAEQHQDATGSDSTKRASSGGSRELDIDLNLIPASDAEI